MVTESKGLWVLGPKRVVCGCRGEGCREECCPGSTTQMWETEARARWDSKEAEEEGGLATMGSYVLPTEERKGG